jgi:DENN (AEX-3) domain
MMTNAASTRNMENFRRILRHAFVSCALDGRRLPFLSRHFAELNNVEQVDEVSPSVELMLFLELTAFVELFGATPRSRRRDIGKRIAYKFFLSSSTGNRMEKPMFDFSHLVRKDILEKLKNLLVDSVDNKFEPLIQRNMFTPFQEAIIDRLCGTPFISFLISDECARMRGYLRGTAPYKTVSPGDIFHRIAKPDIEDDTNNHLLYHILYLLCHRDRESFGENDDIVGEKSSRVIGAAGGLSSVVLMQKTLLPLIENASLLLDKETPLVDDTFQNLMTAFEQLWCMFLSPNEGALELLTNSNETEDEIASLRNLLCNVREKALKEKLDFLTSSEIINSLKSLVENLIYDYSVTSYAKFREHPFHEWMCDELNRSPEREQYNIRIPPLASGCITRLLRRLVLPEGLSVHRPSKNRYRRASITMADGPSNLLSQTTSKGVNSINAHHAIVFGTDDGSAKIDRHVNPLLSQHDIRRYASQQVTAPDLACDRFGVCKIPPTLETYAFSPLPRKSYFSSARNAGRTSSDGWTVTLFDFMIPCTESEGSEDGEIYGVSLVFQMEESAFMNIKEGGQSMMSPLQLVFDDILEGMDKMKVGSESPEKKEVIFDAGGNEDVVTAFASPIEVFSPEKKASPNHTSASLGLRVGNKSPIFNRRISENNWIERVRSQRLAFPTGAPVSVGIVLISSQNVIYAMRESLSKLLWDFSSCCGDGVKEPSENQMICRVLIELLGNFSHLDVEQESLCSILAPYLQYGSLPWIKQPRRIQAFEFAINSGEQLMESLPLVPLALLYLTALLEQKIVFSSSRRSILLSAVTGLVKLLDPFKWEHLLIPLVPAALARDLLDYPAPFIIGLASEDEGNLELLNTLPDDVTLVDLDVGRVILAPMMSFGEEANTSDYNSNPRAKSNPLRSQILHLAQSLGTVFGCRLRPNAWWGDSPKLAYSSMNSSKALFTELQGICLLFVTELVAGTESCCHWIEEHHVNAAVNEFESEPTVIFDEDRFFQIKNLRATGKFCYLFLEDSKVSEFALSLENFDLVLECFLRCQCMSSYISSRPKHYMAFS